MVIKKINEFRQEMLKQYPETIIEYRYYSHNNTYKIWHTDLNSNFCNTDFLSFIKLLIKEKFYDNKIYNINFYIFNNNDLINLDDIKIKINI